MSVDLGKVFTNAISALVATVFVGAAAIVWNEATSVDARIEEANVEIVRQQTLIKATQDTIVPELTGMKNTIEDLRAEIRSLSQLLADAKALPAETEFQPGQPIILDEFLQNRTPDWNKVQNARIQEQIDTRQMELYEQRIPMKK